MKNTVGKSSITNCFFAFLFFLSLTLFASKDPYTVNALANTEAKTQLLHNNLGGSSQSITNAVELHIKFRQRKGINGQQLLESANIENEIDQIVPLFSLPEDTIDKIRATGLTRNKDITSNSKDILPDLNLWYRVTIKPHIDVNSVIKKLLGQPDLEIVELAPIAYPPSNIFNNHLNHQTITPDFTHNQGYLFIAPDGIDAIYSWIIQGGNGTGVTIYDVEYGWNQSHEDLSMAATAPVLMNPGDSIPELPNGWEEHGTAVLGQLIADNNNKGVTGISWGANIGLAPALTTHAGYNPANAILLAMNHGKPGDVILIEQQYPVCGLSYYGPLEVISSVYDTIRLATANGFVVVQAAGNGGVDLDRPECGNIFNREIQDSGSIIVGAGGSPHSGIDRERLGFSTYGNRVDVQGWGTGVITTGYGGYYVDPDNGLDRNRWYTRFGGTSSASPIVAGAVANIQGIAIQKCGQPLLPHQIRTLLVETGSIQLGNVSENIGARPDLRSAIENMPGCKPDHFTKASPSNEATGQSLFPVLFWQVSESAVSYEYCYSSVPGPCTKWNWAGANTSVTLSGLAPNYTYYWQVRAVNAGGATEADNGTWWSFTTTESACSWPAYAPPTSATFGDVPMTVGHWSWVERLANSTITAGCGAGNYCPFSEVNRAQIAIFLLRGKHCGSSYTPPAVGASTGFGDVPLDATYAPWVKQLAAEGVTAGCGNGNFCPQQVVNRAQMAIFLLRARHGATYSPPAVGATTGFGDVPLDASYAPWVKQLAAEGITAGCGNGNFCPLQNVNRAQMATFLVRAFGLP